MARYAEAEPLYERSIAVSEKALAPEHPAVGTSVNNLGMLYQLQGRYADAERLYRRGLAIREKALGADHPDVATSLNNLAMVHHAQGRFAEAEALYNRSLAIRERVVGPNHPELAQSLNNLGLLYQVQERFAEAEPLYRRSLAIFEKAFGPDHPDVGQSFSNLALLAYIQKDWAGAADCWRRTGEIIQSLIGRGLDTGQVKGPGWVPFLGLVKSTYRLMMQNPEQREALGSKMFEAAQWARGSETAASLAQMAARSAKGSPQLARSARAAGPGERVAGERQATHRCQEQTAEATQRPMWRTLLPTASKFIDTRLIEIDRRLARDFPDYAAMASSAPISVAEVQAQLGDNEALMLFLDMPEENPLRIETRARGDVRLGCHQI